MKILNLQVAGFRSLKSVHWSPGDLNIVIGPNASGKSNLLDLLEMLAALPQGGLSEYVQSRGGITSLVWDGRSDLIEIDLGVALPNAREAQADALLLYTLQMAPQHQFGRYQVTCERLQPCDPSGRLFFERVRGVFRGREEATDKKKPILPSPPSEAESLLSVLQKNGPILSREATFLAGQMERLTLYQHLNTSRDAPVRGVPVTQYETQIAADGANLLSVLHTLYNENKAFGERVDSAMSAAFAEYQGLVFPPAADQRIQMRVRWKDLNRSCSSADLSEGTLRFLYLVSILANPTPPSLIAFDEPERGLHPRMMGIVAEYAMEAARRTQVIFTTHSAEFLDAFRDEPPTVTVAELVDGATTLRVVSGEDLAHWLEEFTLGEVYRSGRLEAAE